MSTQSEPRPRDRSSVGRWLLVPLFFALASFTAFMFLMFALFLERECISSVNSAHLNVSSPILLEALDFLVFATTFVLWCVPIAFAIGFGLQTRARASVRWGISVSVVLLGTLMWAVKQIGFPAAVRPCVITAGIVLAVTIAMSFRHHSTRMHVAANLLAFAILSLPWWVLFAKAGKEPPLARKVWVSTIQHGAWNGNTASEFGAIRQLTFAGNRLVAAFESGSAGYEGKTPMSVYTIVSLDARTGRVMNTHDFNGPWGSMPRIFGNADGNVVLSWRGVTLLNPDLTPAGPHYEKEGGGVHHISPDGKVLAWETNPGAIVLNAQTFQPTGIRFQGSPAAISETALLTDNILWYGKYPKDKTFVTLEDERGQHLLDRGICSFDPRFLTEERILIRGCRKLRILNRGGNTVVEKATAAHGSFAGVSQDGQRFALEYNDARGDPPEPIYEYFIIYDSATGEPVSTVRLSDMPERQSWSALSPDGRYFVAGNPSSVSLFEVQ